VQETQTITARVVDGDTKEKSPAVDSKNTVRLIGIDVPESNEPSCGGQPPAKDTSFEPTFSWKASEVELEFDQVRTDSMVGFWPT